MRKLCQWKLPWSKTEMSLQSPLPSTPVASKTWGSHDPVMTFTVFCNVALCTRLEILLDFGKKGTLKWKIRSSETSVSIRLHGVTFQNMVILPLALQLPPPLTNYRIWCGCGCRNSFVWKDWLKTRKARNRISPGTAWDEDRCVSSDMVGEYTRNTYLQLQEA